jgi:hypothetical protein
MKLYSWFVIMGLFFISLGACEEQFSLGPFNVSFDMGFDILSQFQPRIFISNYLSTPGYPGVANEWTEYEAYRDNFKSGNAIEIKITKFPQKMDVNKSLASIVTDETHLVSDQLIEIDGRFGKFWVARDRPHTYSAIWWMNTTTRISIISSYPWNNGTRQLLNTINVTNRVS